MNAFAAGGDGNCLRRIRSSEVNASGRVKKSAFLPRKDGQDKDGLSVSIEDPAFRELHRRKFEGVGRRTCQIRVALVREVQPLDVVPNPDPEDPTHALIVGFPDRTLGVEQLVEAERLADELSRRATEYTFPEAS